MLESLSKVIRSIPIAENVDAVKVAKPLMTPTYFSGLWSGATKLWGSRHKLANPLTGKPGGQPVAGSYII